MAMLDAVYIDSKESRSVLAIKPKPLFIPVFQVATTKEGSGVDIIERASGRFIGGSVFLVETGESRTPRPEEVAQDLLQA